MSKPERPRSKSKANLAFDPSELEDLIHTPAVGLGVSSHLLSRTEDHVTTVATYDVATVVDRNMTTVVEFESPPPSSIWRTESGALLAGRQVRPIQSMEDVLSNAERSVLEFLRGIARPGKGGMLAAAGYDGIGKATGLSRKTVQRLIAKLRDKDILVVDQPADIYTRAVTVYYLRDEAAVLRLHRQRGRTHAARVGPGIVYASPAAELSI